MKKDIEWLKREIPNLRGYVVVIDEIDGGLNPVTTISLKDVYRLINQLDEPEVTHEQVVEWIENNEFYCHATAETVLENAVDKGELGYYGTKYSVVEKPVIPKFVSEWIEETKEKGYPLAYAINSSKGELGEWLHDCDTDIETEENQEMFAEAWMGGYEIEEEPLYYAMVKGHGLLDDVAKYWAYNKYDLEDLFISYETRDDSPIVVKNTKKHWNDLSINDSNADFVKVEEQEADICNK